MSSLFSTVQYADIFYTQRILHAPKYDGVKNDCSPRVRLYRTMQACQPDNKTFVPFWKIHSFLWEMNQASRTFYRVEIYSRICALLSESLPYREVSV